MRAKRADKVPHVLDAGIEPANRGNRLIVAAGIFSQGIAVARQELICPYAGPGGCIRWNIGLGNLRSTIRSTS